MKDLSPVSGDIFLFFGKNRQSVKILRWDGDGFLLYYKRLEGGSFELPTFNQIQALPILLRFCLLS